MHRHLAVWLTEHPWRAAMIAAGLGVLSLQGAVLFVVLASAVPVLVILERGPRAGINVMLAGCAAIIGTLLWLQQPLWFGLAYAAALFGLPVLSGELLRRFGSLNLVFQLMLALALLTIALVFALLLEPTAIWEQLLGQALNALLQAGFTMDATLVARLAQTMWGAFVAVLTLVNISALLLARWWQSLLHAPGEFGREFRELRSGVVLGTLLVMVAVAALIADFAWLDSMAWVAMMGLALQGLAAAHRRKAEGGLQRGWLVAIYVMLIVPLFSFITVALLAGWGLADFWRRMRVGAARPS
ncbi:MAG: hypothetical protein AB7T07_02335 [Steroidobacteraceae bacterium]